jgi:hypothetical protein
MTEALDPHLAGVSCSRADCTRAAEVIAQAVFELHPRVGTKVTLDNPMTLGIPLCVLDAHLVRIGSSLISFSDGLA